MTNSSEFVYRDQPWFDENKFSGFDQAIPIKSIVIHCFDPRVADIPKVVAAHFGDEVYPGETVLDENGARVGSTQTLFVVTNAGGRAVGALESVAAMNYLFNNLERVIVVHHSFCGTTAVNPDRFIEKFHDQFHTDISHLWDKEDLAIMDFDKSLRHDVEMLRNSPGTPKKIKLYGFFYEINAGKLIEIVRDIPEEVEA
jgi:carbonic anhydrase